MGVLRKRQRLTEKEPLPCAERPATGTVAEEERPRSLEAGAAELTTQAAEPTEPGTALESLSLPGPRKKRSFRIRGPDGRLLPIGSLAYTEALKEVGQAGALLGRLKLHLRSV